MIRRIEKAKGKRSAWFDTKRILEIKAFVIAAAITSLILAQKKRKYLALARKIERVKNGAKLLPAFYPIACTALAKCFGFSKSTAMEFKTLAAQSQFILLEKTPLQLFKRNGVPVAPEHLYHIKKTHPKFGQRIFKKKDGRIYIQNIDKVKSLLEVNRRRQIIL